MFINREFPFVLALAFFASVFSTFLWLIYMFMYLKDKLGGMSFGSLGLSDISLYIALLVLPVLVLWMIFGYVTQYLNFHRLNDNMYSLFKQMKKNLEYTDLIARIMLEAEQNGKDGFILNKFDLFITDMNELLAEIIQRGALAAPEQIDSLWAKTRNGAKWAFGKVIIEIDANQGNFGSRLVLKAQNDKVLAGTILEFCARYQNLLGILEKHDKERIFLTMVETGVYGKVYSILAPWGEQIRRKRDFGDLREENEETSQEPRRFSGLSASAPATEEREPLRRELRPQQENTPFAAVSQTEDGDRKSFINMFNPFKHRSRSQEEPETNGDRDPFSMALERSFGTAETDSEPQTPFVDVRHDDDAMPAPVITRHEEERDDKERIRFAEEREPAVEDIRKQPTFSSMEETEIGFTNTQKTLNSLKREWEEMTGIQPRAETKPETETAYPAETRKSRLTQAKDEDYAYPFSGWTDEDNYNK